MKNKKLFFPLILCASFVSLNCSKSQTSKPQENTTAQKSIQKGMEVTIDQRKWNTSLVAATAVEQTRKFYAMKNPDGSLTIIGFGTFTDANNLSYTDRITLNVPNFSFPHATFPLNSNEAVYTKSDTAGLIHFGSTSTNPGALDILSYDTVQQFIKGTFTFTGVSSGNTVQLTNGQFDSIPLLK